ncbi:unnamed protein product [Cylindrotheca closterium]|uniref:Uncharacterized protein n=1 Tax=Cylindrotheca closterium TaxID=2856 RepID=A0AAD2CHV1_9STRA|nr:unnamed protein product [Cylindrotheca closterium]
MQIDSTATQGTPGRQQPPSSSSFVPNSANTCSFSNPTQMSPNQKTAPLFPQPGFSPPATVRAPENMTNSPAPSLASTDTLSLFAGGSRGVNYDREGTAFNRHQINVDFQFPEAHKGFIVEHNPRKVCNGYHCQTMVLTREIGMEDLQSQSAYMHDGCIIFQGPTRPLHIMKRLPNLPENPLAAKSDIRNVHHQTVAHLKLSPMCGTSFWKMVIPEDWELDNACLSNDASEVVMTVLPLGDNVNSVQVNAPLAHGRLLESAPTV